MEIIRTLLEFLGFHKKPAPKSAPKSDRHRIAELKMILQYWNEKISSGAKVPSHIPRLIKNWSAEKSNLEARITNAYSSPQQATGCP